MGKMCKKIISLLGMILIMMFLTSVLEPDCNVKAAKKAEYTYKTEKIGGTYKGKTTIKTNCSYTKVVLKGKAKGIKKINKFFEKKCKEWVKEDSLKDLAIRNAKDGFEESPLYEKIKNKVTYNDNNIISIKSTYDYFGGGVSNTSDVGYTFSLKSGKLLSISDVYDGSSSQLKKELVASAKSTLHRDGISYKDITSKKVEKLDFYLQPDNKLVVCFEPYTVDNGPAGINFTIKSKYK